MPEVDELAVAMQNLRAVIHSLRMNNLAFVDSEALDEIRSMIKSLPAPEELNGLATSPESIKKVQENVGGILRLIELYSRRDGEYKTRYKSRTGLPPRYKVMEWRETMSNRNTLVKDLVRLSGEVDAEGFSKFAASLLSCAKEVKGGKLPVEELLEASDSFLRKANVQSRFIKIAQGLPALRDPGLGGIRKGLEQIQIMFSQIQQAFTDKLQYLNKSPKTQKFIQQLGKIWQGVAQLEKATGQQIDALQQPMAQIEEAMEQTLIPQSIMFQNKPTPIEWVPDPDDPGMEMAVINVNGQQYEVQSDDAGTLSVKPAAAPAGAASGAPVPAAGAPETTQQMQGAPTAPTVPETSGQGQQKRLEDLGRQELVGLMQKHVPNIPWKQQNGQPLDNNAIIDILKRNVGQSIFQNLGIAAESKVFNLKRYSSKK